MNQSSGSRFNQQQTYYESPQYPSNNNNTPQYPPNNYTAQSPYDQNRFPTNPNIPTQTVPLNQQQSSPFLQVTSSLTSDTDFLLLSYTAQEKAKIKSENKQKYNMNPESIVYKLDTTYIEYLVFKYPLEFPSQLRDELPKNIYKLRSDFNKFRRLFFGGVVYWAIFRRRAWFKLTSNPIMRLCFGFICINHMIELSFTEKQYVTQNAYMYNSQLEDVIKKYNLNVNNPSRMDTVA